MELIATRCYLIEFVDSRPRVDETIKRRKNIPATDPISAIQKWLKWQPYVDLSAPGVSGDAVLIVLDRIRRVDRVDEAIIDDITDATAPGKEVVEWLEA